MALIVRWSATSDSVVEEATPMPPPPVANADRQVAQKVIPKPDLQQKYCANSFEVTCNSSWPSTDPTGSVKPDVTGEVRALRIMRRLIRENPTWTAEQVQEVLAENIYTEERRVRVQNAFAWVVSAMRTFIDKQADASLSANEKAALLNQISRISLELPPPVSVYTDAADLITKSAVYYERTPRETLRLRMGGAYLLASTSWFNIVYTFAHEVAHAIDPCEAKHAGIWPRSYDGLVACFVKSGWVEQDRAECGPNEQVSEVFADWVASELIGYAIEEFGKDYSNVDRAKAAINAARDLCEQPIGDSLDFRLHQEPMVRIGSVLGLSPSLRKAVRCPAGKSANYCRL